MLNPAWGYSRLNAKLAPVLLKTVLGSSHPSLGCCAPEHVFAKVGVAGDGYGKLLSPRKEGLKGDHGKA